MKAKRGSETTATMFAIAFSTGVGVWVAQGGAETVKAKLGGGLVNFSNVGENTVLGEGTANAQTFKSANGELATAEFNDKTLVQSQINQTAYDPAAKTMTIRSGSTSVQMGNDGVKKYVPE